MFSTALAAAGLAAAQPPSSLPPRPLLLPGVLPLAAAAQAVPAVLPPAAAEPAGAAPAAPAAAAEAPVLAPANAAAGPADAASPVEVTLPAVSHAAAAAAPAADSALDDVKLPPDPLAFFNRPSFAISMVIDKIILRPAAMIYRHAVPRPLRDGAHNILSNLHEPVVFLNDFFQLRPKRMVRTLGRFIINTAIGVGGLFDLAKRKPFHLPHRDNGFADTLGYYGIGPGPYLYLPVIGPTTFRDAAGRAADEFSHPRLLGLIAHPKRHGPVFQNKLTFGRISTVITVVSGLDERERNDDDLKALLSDAVDPYATFRAAYLQDRAAEIAELKAKDGHAPAIKDFADPLTDPAAAAPPVSGGKPAPKTQ